MDKENLIFNKRKLNEFLYVIDQIQPKELMLELMKKHLYTDTSEESFFNVLQKYYSIIEYESDKVFNENNGVLNFILPAAYYGHNEILKWLIAEKGHDVNAKNNKQQAAIHFGIIKFYNFLRIKINGSLN